MSTLFTSAAMLSLQPISNRVPSAPLVVPLPRGQAVSHTWSSHRTRLSLLSYSLILGRPPSISDAYTDALPPSNVEMSELDALMDPSKPPPEAKPLSQPTTATFLILRRDLAGIVGRIVHHFQKLHEPAQYGDVEKLQHELDQFVERLPPHFRMHEPDKSLDQGMLRICQWTASLTGQNTGGFPYIVSCC